MMSVEERRTIKWLMGICYECRNHRALPQFACRDEQTCWKCYLLAKTRNENVIRMPLKAKREVA